MRDRRVTACSRRTDAGVVETVYRVGGETFGSVEVLRATLERR
jgi:hypothetical protein